MPNSLEVALTSSTTNTAFPPENDSDGYDDNH